MNSENLVRRTTLVCLAALVPTLTGCSSGSVTSPDPVLAFAPQSVVTHGLRFETSPRSVNTFLEIEIVAVQLGDVASLSYDVTYPDDLFHFTDFEEGPYLSEDGAVDTGLQVTETSVGMIRVEHARAPGSGPLDAEFPEGVTLLLGFEGYATGEGTFAVENIRALRSDGSEIEDIDPIEAVVIIDISNAS